MPDPSTLLRAYLVIGPDELKRRAACDRLKAYLDESFLDFNLDERKNAGTIDAQELISSLRNLPMGGALRLVIVHDADKLTKEASEAIVSYLEAPNPQCTLALEAEKLAKNTHLYKAIAAQGKQAVVEFAALKRYELAPYVGKLAEKYGLRIRKDAAEELIERVGESSSSLDNQLASLAKLLEGKQEIRLEDVRAYVVRTAEQRPWALLDALSARNAHRSFELYSRMTEPSHVYLHALIVGRLRELICAKSLDERGEAQLLASNLGKADWQVKNHLMWSRNFSSGELEGLLQLAAACERVLKGTGDNETAFTRFLFEICGV